MNFQDDIPSIPIDNFKDHYVQVFDLISLKELLKIFITQNQLKNHRGWSYTILFPKNTLLNSLYWGNWTIGTLVHFPLTMFWVLTMRLLPLKYATQQYAGWAMDNDCKLSSQSVIWGLSRSIQFVQAAAQAVDARTFTIPSQRLQFLHDFCSFSFLQFPTIWKCWSSRC